MAIFTLGIDLAKNVFVLHGVDQYGKAVLIKPKVARGQLLEMVAQLPPMPHHSPRNQVNYPRTLKPTATENGGTSQDDHSKQDVQSGHWGMLQDAQRISSGAPPACRQASLGAMG